jgi:hypothetical protein
MQSVELAKLRAFRDANINRISLGIQVQSKEINSIGPNNTTHHLTNTQQLMINHKHSGFKWYRLEVSWTITILIEIFIYLFIYLYIYIFINIFQKMNIDVSSVCWVDVMFWCTGGSRSNSYGSNDIFACFIWSHLCKTSTTNSKFVARRAQSQWNVSNSLWTTFEMNRCVLLLCSLTIDFFFSVCFRFWNRTHFTLQFDDWAWNSVISHFIVIFWSPSQYLI